jgi:ribosomal protein S18 acetylase RimI-like enzyme
VEWFELGITVTLLALMEKHAVGFAMLRRLEHGWSLPSVSELLSIAVEPAKWRLGIGDLLMDEILREAERIEVETLVLHTAIDNLPARILFRKHGFSKFGMKKKYYPKGQDAIMMYKDISWRD